LRGEVRLDEKLSVAGEASRAGRRRSAGGDRFHHGGHQRHWILSGLIYRISESRNGTFHGVRADMATKEEILTSAEARRYLKIGRTKLWQLTKEQRIPSYRLGDSPNASLRYKRSELLRCWRRTA